MKRIAAALLTILTGTSYAQELIIYPAVQGVIYNRHNDDYTVRVRKLGGEWQDLFEYNVQVDMDKPQDASMAYFDFSGKVEISVKKNNGHIQTVKIRPLSFDILPTLKGNTITFTLNQPRNISIEFNDDKLHNLHLFANTIEAYKPDLEDTNVLYFGPGIHISKDTIRKAFVIPSNKTVYIDGSAILRSKLICNHVENVRIIGRGIIDQAERGIEITHSKNVTVSGIIVANPKHYTIYGGESKNIAIRNLKSFSVKGWGDGIDLMSCSDVAIDQVFMRNADDCIAIYGHRWDFYGNARNYNITNSVLWADIAHPINIGLHGNTEKEGEIIENIRFKNIDILEHDEDDPNYQGCMAISNGDLNLVRNISFEDIRIDDFEEGQLLNLRVVFNEKYNTGPGRGIENITFKNISYNGDNIMQSVIGGLDAKHIVKNISFENIKINGKVITNAAEGNIRIDKYVQGILFK